MSSDVLFTDGHLGGFVPGGDPATQFPELWDWLVDGPLKICSVLDVGCGDGQAVSHFAGRGVWTLGVDGVPQPGNPNIVLHDFTQGPFLPKLTRNERFHLCWSCEFVEHVAEPYRHNFLETFACADLVLMTHATPGQPGWHHVNCQDRQYWVDALATVGFDLDEQLTVRCRILAARNDNTWNHFIRSGLAFVPRGTPPYRDPA